MPLNVATISPDRAGAGKVKRTVFCASSFSRRSIRSRALIRLWTCLALLAFERNRSMKSWVFAMVSSCLAMAESRAWARRSFSVRYSS